MFIPMWFVLLFLIATPIGHQILGFVCSAILGLLVLAFTLALLSTPVILFLALRH